MEPSSFIPMNPRDYLILFSLTAEDRHGYGILKDIEDGSGGQVRIDPANLYRVIKRMLGLGLVAEAEGESEGADGDDRRRFYRITELGRRAVALEAERLAALTAAARARALIPGEGPA